LSRQATKNNETITTKNKMNMQQHLKQLMMTLALLLTAVTGAWADGVTMKEITSSDIQSSWNGNTDPVKATDLPGFKAMTHDEAVALGAPSNNEKVYLIYAINASNKFAALIYEYGTKSSYETEFNLKELQSHAQNYWVYYTYSDAPAAAPAGPEVAWNETDKAWEFEMPEEGDVELEIAYKTVSQMTLTFDGEAIAAEGVTGYLRQESAFVSALAAAVTGVDDATFTVESSDATVIAFGESNAATGALADVKFLKEGQATLTVTFAGNDDYGRASQTIAVTVTEMTYDVALKEGAAHADQWQLKAGDGDFQVLQQPVTGVKATTKMKLKFTGDKSLLKGVRVKKKAAAPATVDLDASTTAWTDGSTFAVPAGGLTYSDAITVSGDVTLVLTDGETLTLNKGISLASGATLTIQGNGAMVVNGTNNSTASTVAGSTGTLILTSGTLTATGGNGAGVGYRTSNRDNRANAGGNAINGNVTVSGGTLRAKGGNGGGVEQESSNSYGAVGGVAISGSVTVTGGTVTATGGNGGGVAIWCNNSYGGAGGAAIGGDATLNGGTWTASDGTHGANGEGQGGAGGKAVAGTVTDNR
jgi:hypothetical protein